MKYHILYQPSQVGVSDQKDKSTYCSLSLLTVIIVILDIFHIHGQFVSRSASENNCFISIFTVIILGQVVLSRNTLRGSVGVLTIVKSSLPVISIKKP